MRYRIVKQVYGDETYNFHIKEKGLFFWSKKSLHFSMYTPRVIYYSSLDEALEEVKRLIHSEMSQTIVDVEVVYDTKVTK